MRTLLLLLLVGLTAAGCKTLVSTRSGEVTGTVTYLPRIALPPDAVVEVQLQDESAGEARVVDSQTIRTDGQQVPIAFRLRYDPLRLNTAGRYVVRAQITSGGQTLFSSAEGVPVITQGYPIQNVEVRVQQTGGGM